MINFEQRGPLEFCRINKVWLRNAPISELIYLPVLLIGITPPPGRPILSTNDAPTERISEFVDHFLQPFIPTMKSYVKNTTDFVNKIESVGRVPEGTLLVTLDIVSLYTNIPHLEGLGTIQRLLNARRTKLTNPTNNDLIRLLALVLRLNHFEFNNTYWDQFGGVAMGSRVSPTFANLFMEEFEEQNVYTYPHQPLRW